MYLKKTMLAVAITMATSGYALAATVNLNNNQVSLESQYFEPLTFTGTQTGNLDPLTIDNVKIGGDLTNQATVSATGDGAVGVLVRNATVGNGEANASTFSGDVINKGVVTANGANANGFSIESSTAASFMNTEAGKIVATGAGSTGLHFTGAQTTGVLQNDGLISGEGVGLDLDSSPDGMTASTLRNIDNSGTIIGTGANSRGLLVDGVSFYEQQKGIINNGTIKGGAIGIDFDQFAIKVDPTNTDPNAGNIEMNHLVVRAETGEIAGGEYAIKGADGRVDLILGNTEGRGVSTIRGNLDGLALTNVIGPADFFGTNIKSELVRVNNGASLTLNNAHTNIEGDLSVLSGGTLGLPLSAETLTNTPVLNVTGTADLASGSTVVINAKGSDFAKGGSTYDLISAQTLNIAPDVAIKSSSALLTVNSTSLANGKLNVQVASVGNDETGTVIENGGGNANTQAATKSFMSVAELLGNSNPNDPVLKALIAAGSDAKEIAKVAKQLTPEVNGGAASAANSSITLVNNAISSRSNSLRSGESSGDVLHGTGAWFQILSSEANQDVRSGVDGYDANSRGFALGADHKLNDNTVLGVAYSYVKTNVESDNGNKTDVENNTLTAYGTWTEGNYFVDGGVSYGKGKNDSKRYIAGTTAKGNYDSDMIGLNVMGGYGFHFDHNILVEPRVTARYTNLSIDGFSEKGSSAALKTGDQRLEVGEIGAGVRVAGAFDLGKGTLEPEFKLMGYHDLIADKSSTTSAFTLGGNSFVATGATPARDSYEVGIGANYKLGAVTIGGSYERLMKTGFDADAFTAKVRYDF